MWAFILDRAHKGGTLVLVVVVTYLAYTLETLTENVTDQGKAIARIEGYIANEK